MSPHVVIGEALEQLDQRYSRRADKQTESLIVARFAAGAINADEFKHYCERARHIAERHKEDA
ncbi:hypothetical protein [Pseudomonas sp. F16(2018)]|uniref:hypothetical protein n=1 Tax=Pseudomonas sp. F16(2018) TaxID=2093746 RepID=UPI00111BAE31|nr:hypothetical protein [Pseudomonas sp. F16(2018)]